MSTRRDDDLLTMMLQDMPQAPELYRPTRFWIEASKLILRDLQRHGVSSFRSHRSARRMYVPQYANRPLTVALRNLLAMAGLLGRLVGIQPRRIEIAKRLLLNAVDGTNQAFADYRVLVAAESDRPPRLLGLSESQYGSPPEHYCFDGHRYSESFLRYLVGLAYLKKMVDTERFESALEIGGGYGTLGEILLSCGEREYFYVNVDIPPLSFISTRYLQGVFGADAVASYAETRDMECIDLDDLRRRYRAVVLCSWQLPRVRGAVDLFVNIASFQEMEPRVVENYVRHVQPLTRRWALLRNRARGKPVVTASGGIGVDTPTVRTHYLDYFAEFDLVASDATTSGTPNLDGNPTETMVLRRKDSRD